LNFEEHQKFYQMQLNIKKHLGRASRQSVVDVMEEREQVNDKLLQSRKSLVDYDSLQNCLTHNASGSKKRYSFRQGSWDNVSRTSDGKMRLSSKVRFGHRDRSFEKIGAADTEITQQDLKAKGKKQAELNPAILLRINDSSAQNLE
jgi:hypothetical protein